MEKEVLLKITDLSRGGAGVSRDDQGRIVFVPYTAPGDEVRVRILKTEKRYLQGECLEVLKPSVLRQKPRCPAFGVCGGCHWQHLPYSIQWQTKVQGLAHALQRVKIAFPHPIKQFPATQIWEYRNRIQLRGSHDQIGFFKAGSNQRVSVDRCDLARPEMNKAWETLREEGRLLKKPFKVEVEVTPEGKLRTVWNSRHSSLGFRQVHDEQNEKLKNWVYEVFKKESWILDLYGGSGNFSLNLQETAQEIHCVDVGAPGSGLKEGTSRFYFHKKEVLSWLHSCVQNRDRWLGPITKQSTGVAILDPPREGLAHRFSEIAQSLEFLGISQIVMIGCDVDSWVRDISRWLKCGWELNSLLAVDFFPQTYHLECVGHLIRARIR